MKRFCQLHKPSITLTCLGFTLLCLLSGCARPVSISTLPAAPAPENIPFENPHQSQLQSAAQWHVIAEDMATQLIKTIQEKKLGDKPFYIFAQNKPSTFNRAFNDFLITTLVNKGVKISSLKQGSRVFNYKIQLVEYEALRETVVSSQLKYTALAAGLVVFRNMADWLGVDGTVLAAGATADAVDFNIAPNLEIILTASVMNGPIYLSRSTDIYYVNRSDKALYTPQRQQRASDVFNDPFYQMK